MVEECEEFLSPDEVEPYYEMIITAESALPIGAETTHTCNTCGFESFDRTKLRMFMQPEMWRGDDVFYLATSLWIIITKATLGILESMDASNFAAKPMRAMYNRDRKR